MAYKIKTQPTVEPVTLTEAKAHLAIDHTFDDTYVTSLITAARQQAENYLAQQLCTATWELHLDKFENVINISKSPLVSIDSIKYTDTDGNEQTLDTANYILDKIRKPARLVPAYNKTWPSTQEIPNAVCITFTSGYGVAADVPQVIKSAILLIVGHLYENRGDEGHRTIPQTVWNLLDVYSVIFYDE